MYQPITKPVDPTALTPIDFWRSGAQFPPDITGVGERYEQFSRYSDLAMGDFDSILPQYANANNDPVQSNYFATIADLRTRFMMQYPPEVGLEEQLMDEFILSLIHI